MSEKGIDRSVRLWPCNEIRFLAFIFTLDVFKLTSRFWLKTLGASTIFHIDLSSM